MHSRLLQQRNNYSKGNERAFIQTYIILLIAQLTFCLYSSNTIPRGALSSVSLKGTVLENTCLEPISCNVTKYRSIDGSCNNLVNPHWGQRNTVFQRLLPAHYGNGKDLFLSPSRIMKMHCAIQITRFFIFIYYYIRHRLAATRQCWRGVGEPSNHQPVYRQDLRTRRNI